MDVATLGNVLSTALPNKYASFKNNDLNLYRTAAFVPKTTLPIVNSVIATEFVHVCAPMESNCFITERGTFKHQYHTIVSISIVYYSITLLLSVALPRHCVGYKELLWDSADLV